VRRYLCAEEAMETALLIDEETASYYDKTVLFLVLRKI